MNTRAVLFLAVIWLPALIISSYVPYLGDPHVDVRVIMIMLLGFFLAVPGPLEWLDKQIIPQKKENTSPGEENFMWRIIGLLLVVGGIICIFVKYQSYMLYR